MSSTWNADRQSAALKAPLTPHISLLVLMSVLLITFAGSTTVFTVAVCVGTFVGVYGLYILTLVPNRITFSGTLAASLLLGYAGGAFVYLATNLTMDPVSIQRSWIYFSQPSLSLALAMVLLSSAALLLAAKIEGPLGMRDLADQDASSPQRIFWAGIVVVVLAFLFGDIGYMGSSVVERKVSPLGALANILAPSLLPYGALLLFRSPGRRVLLAVGVVILAVALLPQGRRYLIYAAVLAFIALGMSGSQRIGWKHFLAAAITAWVLYEGFHFFLALRQVVWQTPADFSFAAQVQLAIQMSNHEIIRVALIDNLSSRTFILSYLAGLIEHAGPRVPLWGAEAGYAIVMAVPGMFVSKAGLASVAEEFVHPRYGVPVFDGPGSILVSGYNDFGWIGIFAYPILLVVLYAVFYRLVGLLVRDAYLRILVIFALLFHLLYVEESLVGLIVVVRNISIVLVVGLILTQLPAIRLTERRFGNE